MEETQNPNATVKSPAMFSSWGISLVLHALLMVILTFTITQVTPPPKGINPEETAEASIAFRSYTNEKVLYESASEAFQVADVSETNASEDTSLKTDAEKIAALTDIISGMDAPAMPTFTTLGAGVAPTSGSGSTGLDSITDGLGTLDGVGSGTFEGFGKGKVSCFGTSGEGNTFIFVFDRSASMSFRPSGTTVTPIYVAKQELRRSLRMLQSNQQFQIIFYNGSAEDILQFEANKMIFATKENLVSAERFLGTITAFGGTDHQTALSLALRQHPDVIFFMTDADENETTLTASDLERLRRNANKTQINAIQFGSGPRPAKSNWLARLAEQNGGQYIYLDVNELGKK